jgi:hypothetical protein
VAWVGRWVGRRRQGIGSQRRCAMRRPPGEAWQAEATTPDECRAGAHSSLYRSLSGSVPYHHPHWCQQQVKRAPRAAVPPPASQPADTVIAAGITACGRVTPPTVECQHARGALRRGAGSNRRHVPVCFFGGERSGRAAMWHQQLGMIAGRMMGAA